MENVDKIYKFLSHRPKVIGAFGYGSGVFKQASYTNMDKPQIDLIFIVEDIKKWHKENIIKNPKDYSMVGKIFLKHFPLKFIKGATNITYQSNILEDSKVFKYGVIEYKDFINSLSNWDTLYIAGRFQKMVLPIITNNEMNELIERNRKSAFLISLFLLNKDEKKLKDLFIEICSLSYYGDTRMKIAENPLKISNIVQGSYYELNQIYNGFISIFNDIISKDNEIIFIDDQKKIKYINDFPLSLKNYINKNDIKNLNVNYINKKIYDYFKEKNQKESINQTLKGILTNGIINSIKYVIPKLKKGLNMKKHHQ